MYVHVNEMNFFTIRSSWTPKASTAAIIENVTIMIHVLS